MSWTGFLRFWRRSDSSTATDVGQDIDEELMFHLRALIDVNLAKGMPTDDAWRDAQERFGSIRRYADSCRRATLSGRLVFQGLPALGLLVLGLLIGWLSIEVRSLRRDQIALLQAQSHRETEKASMPAILRSSPSIKANSPMRADFAGSVVDRQSKPISDANVLVILKTWPDGHYQQENFATTTDVFGRFCLKELVPSDGQHAIHVAIVKDGYALMSAYQLKAAGSSPAVDPVMLELDEAPRITLVVHDARDRPVANARVFPSRRSRDGEDHAVYFQASGPVQSASDAEGRVGLGCFERGDKGEIYLQLPGKDWESRAIAIPEEGDTVVVSASQTVDAIGDDSPNPAQKSRG